LRWLLFPIRANIDALAAALAADRPAPERPIAQKIVAFPINDLGTLQVTVRRLIEASFATASLRRAL
jgi:hypothetical protein